MWDVATAAGAVLGALAGSGATAAFVTSRAARTQRRRDLLVADVRDAQDVLVELRRACRQRVLGVPGAPRHDEIALLTDRLELAATRTLDDRIIRLASAYAAAAAQWMDDVDTHGEVEVAAYRQVSAALRALLAANR